MKLQLLAIPFLAALLLALAAAPACGGDDASPPEQYFRQLQETRAELSQRFTALQDEFDAALASESTDAEITEAARDYYGGNLSILEDTISRLEEIEPPAEAAEAHQEFVEAVKGFVAVSEDLSARAERAESVSELEDLLAGADRDEFDAVAGRFEEACLALQDIADANGIAADLNCEG